MSITRNTNETSQEYHARIAREHFARVKDRARTSLQKARVSAYEAYKASVVAKNIQYGAAWNPCPFNEFKWRKCVLCKEEIRDDPYGHNPYPLAKRGHCCGKCNGDVVQSRWRSLGF